MTTKVNWVFIHDLIDETKTKWSCAEIKAAIPGEDLTASEISAAKECLKSGKVIVMGSTIVEPS